MSDSEAPESLGLLRLGRNFEQSRKPAAKVVFLGDQAVGKSSIMEFLLNGYTTDRKKQRATIMLTHFGEISLTVDGGSVGLEMWDTAGQEQFRALTSNFFRGAHGAVLVYDVTRKDTLTHLFEAHKVSKHPSVPSWLDQFLDFFKESGSSVTDAHIAVLGNKADKTGEMEVHAEEAKETIDCELKKRGLVDHVFYETSALNGQNLDEFAKTFASKFKEFSTPSPLDPRAVFQPPERAPERPAQRKRSGCC